MPLVEKIHIFSFSHGKQWKASSPQSLGVIDTHTATFPQNKIIVLSKSVYSSWQQFSRVFHITSHLLFFAPEAEDCTWDHLHLLYH